MKNINFISFSSQVIKKEENVGENFIFSQLNSNY